MDEIYVKEICKLGHGEKCCSFLAAGAGGFTCLKNSGLKSLIDERRASGTMNAKGDNCKSFLVETTGEKVQLSPLDGPWANKICQCDKCGCISRCTMMNDFYDQGDTFLCEQCLLKEHNITNWNSKN